jgi:hypothetical protein
MDRWGGGEGCIAAVLPVPESCPFITWLRMRWGEEGDPAKRGCLGRYGAQLGIGVWGDTARKGNLCGGGTARHGCLGGGHS